jgi:hypothetical protein
MNNKRKMKKKIKVYLHKKKKKKNEYRIFKPVETILRRGLR